VEAGYLAKLINDPALAISFAASYSPIKNEVLGAIAYILFLRYSPRDSLYSFSSIIYSARFYIYFSSYSVISDPIES